jgi:hypothetical protein
VNGINACFANVMLIQVLVVLLAQCILAFHVVFSPTDSSSISQQDHEMKLALTQSILFLTVVIGAMAYLASTIMHMVSVNNDLFPFINQYIIFSCFRVIDFKTHARKLHGGLGARITNASSK